MDTYPPLNDIYQSEAEEPGSGFDGFLEETRDLEPFLANGARLRQWYSDGDYPAMRSWASELLLEHHNRDNSFLFRALFQSEITKISNMGIIAYIYFTFVLLSRR